jgi:hypothetical protein
MSVAIAAGPAGDAFGTLSIRGADIPSAADFLLGFASPTVPMIPLASDDPSVRLVGIEGDDAPLFVFRGDVWEFRKVPRWRRIVSHVVFLHVLHLRSDLHFFHAASIGIHGNGVMLVGPKGSGKSTASLALAARGHALLGDETAAFDPATSRLLPMPRPVGIKPGPRARSVDQAMRAISWSADEDNMTRIPIRALFPEAAAADPAPLRAVIFLNGFGPDAVMTSTSPGREELSAMQPLRSSSYGGNPALRVFEMIRMLSAVKCYALTASDPDYTAQIIEETLTHDAIG